MAEPLVSIEWESGVAVLCLNRPARHNALVPELLEALCEKLCQAEVREAGSLVLAARGTSFSTGGDLLGFWQHRDQLARYAHELVGWLNRAMLELATIPVRVACAVQGPVTGGSLGLLLAADRVFMHPEAWVAPWYSVVGFSPDGGWASVLPHRIGPEPARRWLAENGRKNAEACAAIGLADELAIDPRDAAIAWASMPGGDRDARRRHSRLEVERWRAGLERERSAFVRQVQTRRALDGIRAYLGIDETRKQYEN
ncbi:MAG: enoyl-CoA hydratase/isomerase family protein [Xanthomonadales bacterium]|nr:enoyl-CoA hydratase/isomerase family protein [Xanthomonadales bacterium]